MIKKSRLDLYLLNKGLCETRQKAQGLILAGKVRDINGKVLDKPGQQVLIGSEFFIDSAPMFVSRGGEKLLEAFKKLKIKVKDKICIDAGISTGGFTDCLLQQGAKLVAGGPGKPDGMNEGYYVKPTVFADVNNQMEIARTEIFGPVLSVIPFETEEEAIEIANDTDYGLTNYIQSKDSEKIRRLARKLRSGMVDVNGAGIAVDAPFGGFKHSGIGREAGKEGLLEFLEVKSVGGWS